MNNKYFILYYLDYFNIFMGNFLSSILFIFMFNSPFYWFEPITLVFWNQIINWIIFLFITYFTNIWLILLWRSIYKKLKLKRKNYWNIYFLAFVLRIFPILSIFASILLWMNNEKLNKVIKIFSIWFILYTIVWFILYKYFELSWWNLFAYLF